jgi:hypothetical protein
LWRAAATLYSPATMSKRLTLLVLALLAVAAVPALAATKNGVTPLYPKAGAIVPGAKTPTFKAKVVGKGPVYFYVCKRAKRDKTGLICDNESIEQAKKVAKNRYQAKMKYFDYPDNWLNSPGTYYWQAHRIACVNGTKDCAQEGPVVKFKVG